MMELIWFEAAAEYNLTGVSDKRVQGMVIHLQFSTAQNIDL